MATPSAYAATRRSSTSLFESGVMPGVVMFRPVPAVDRTSFGAAVSDASLIAMSRQTPSEPPCCLNVYVPGSADPARFHQTRIA